jgi:DNA polymerase III alpha subunit
MWTETNSLEQLAKGVIKHGPEILAQCQTSDDIQKYLDRVELERLDYPLPKSKVDPTHWFIPYEYQNIDIEEFLVNQCPSQNYHRLIAELDLYKQHEMIPVLKTMKYIVDTLESKGIVWGVGRGSSVASYVLFLMGVHSIDSVKYNLPIEEFFKGDTNG